MIRSLLYVPADRPDRIVKACAAGADAVLIDLEDAVAPSAKAAARRHAVEALHHQPAVPLWVRINAGDAGRADIEALAASAIHPAGVVLAKCDDPVWIDEVAARLPPPVTLAPLVESARALRRLDELCAHPRVGQCHLGEIDLLADIGVRPAGAAQVLGSARVDLLVASAAAQLLPPIAGVYADIRDLDGLAAESAQLADLGFGGRPALHPAQVSAIDAAFRPSADEIDAARRLVALLDDAHHGGVGAVTDEAGRMVDEAVARRARQLAGHDTGRSDRTTTEATTITDV